MVIVLFFFIQFFLGSSLWFKGCSDWPPPGPRLAIQCLSWVLLPLFKELPSLFILGWFLFLLKDLCNTF